jgi:hypothetical protein
MIPEDIIKAHKKWEDLHPLMMEVTQNEVWRLYEKSLFFSD